MTVVHDITTKICAECGREISVLHPDQWAYKKPKGSGHIYWCSWSCLREAEKKGMLNMAKLTLDDKKHAVKIALDGGNPLEYIRMCGVKNAAESWMKIKNDLKQKDPATWEMLPKRLPNMKKEETALVPEVVPEEMVKPVVIDTPDGPKEITAEKISQMTPEEVSQANVAMMAELVKRTITSAVNYDGFTVRAVQGVYGQYLYDKTSMGEYIDFENNDGDELSMTVDNWRAFIAELNHAAAVLGVEL